MIPALTTPCYEPQCVVLTSTTIPGPNPACPTTPTITAYGACPTTATCRKGCRTETTTKTGTSYSCEVSWETGTSRSEATFETAATDSTYASWDESTIDAASATTTDANCILPPCYSRTVPAVFSCPALAPPHPPCAEPECAILTTTTIPGPNPACPITPTVTTTEACPTTSTCRKGCLVITSTVTAPNWSPAFGVGETGCVVTTTETIVPPCAPTVCLADEFLCPLPTESAEVHKNVDLEECSNFSTTTVTSYAACPTCGVDCATSIPSAVG